MAVETEFPGGTVPTSNAKWQLFATGRTFGPGEGVAHYANADGPIYG